MKERPILFSAPMVRAILESRKTQTRRIVKPKPVLMYSLDGDRIKAIHNDEDGINEIDQDCWWHNPEANSSLSEFGLHGRGRWANILAHSIRGLWQEGVRGLVCVERPQDKKGVLNCVLVPRQQEGDKECSPAYLHGFSRDAVKKFNAGSSPGWQPREQLAKQLGMGDATGELAGSVSSRQWDFRRKASRSKTDRQGALSPEMGDKERTLQPAPCRSNSWDNPSIRISLNEFVAGRLMWVRETWRYFDESNAHIHFAADGTVLPRQRDPEVRAFFAQRATFSESQYKWKPSIHMPRWASRITLEIVSVRVERLKEISGADALAEGVTTIWPDGPLVDRGPNHYTIKIGHINCNAPTAADVYGMLWESISGTGSWDANPWVWVVEFKRVQP